MVGDIGGLYDGLFLITGFLLRWYSTSMFEIDFVKSLFKFQKRLVNSSSENIEKVSKADLVRITEHFERQQILELPACLILASKVLCKALFKSDHRLKLKKLERANQEMSRALDIGQILRWQQMTRILAECLLSPHSLHLAERVTAKRVLNEDESGE
jgi:hypothetical protein